ncbi:MAG: hypothetical protein WC273_03070 [Dehalococcoidia bacterium]
MSVLLPSCLALLAVLLPGKAPGASAAGPLAIPAAAGSQWQVASGYNTATHSVADKNDPYAIDIVRTDAPTEGTQVLAPFDGRVQYADASCLSIVDAQSTTVLMCHLFPVAGIRGKTVTRGQGVGTVAPPGQANNNGLAHIHMALSDRLRAPVPFAGAYALEGVALPATASADAYAGTTFLSTNTPAMSVDLGPDLQVRPGTAGTLTATVTGGTPLSFAWRQTSGPTVPLTANGSVASFVAPGTIGSTLAFQVVAVSATAQSATATVSVRTSATAPLPPAPGAAGTFAATPTFGTIGLALAVYNGGTVAQLEAAARAAEATGVWAQDANGGYQLLVIGGPAFVNDAFRTRFAGGFSRAAAVTLVR